jgi:transposase
VQVDRNTVPQVAIPLDLTGFEVVGQEVKGRLVEVVVIAKAEAVECSACRHLTAKVHDRRPRRLLDQPLGQYQLTLVVIRRRFRCPFCERVFTEPDEIAGRRRRLTKRLRARIFEEAKSRSVKEVAEAFGVSDKTVRGILAEHFAEAQAGDRPSEPLRLLGIDEFSIRKGQRYATGLHDLERHRLIEVVEGRKAEAVQKAIEGLAEAAKESIKAVSMDLSGPFRLAVETVLPDARIVADRFHVVAWVNEALKAVWKRLLKGKGRDEPLRKLGRLLLGKGETLGDEERRRLWEALKPKEYRELRLAWLLKEELRRWYRATKSTVEARLQLRAWRGMLLDEGTPKEFRALVPTLDSWREQLLAFFEYRVTQGPVEGRNNQVKVIERQAYGYRNFQNLRRRLLLAS